MAKFVDIVKEATSLSIEEMQELKLLLEKELFERKRNEILGSRKEAKTEYDEAKPHFYDDTKDLVNSDEVY